jgi:hypothetical protein
MVLPRLSAATMPSSMRRSYRDRSGSGPPSGSRSPGPAAGPLSAACLGMVHGWVFREMPGTRQGATDPLTGRVDLDLTTL